MNFKIKASTKGGAVGFKDVTISIIICGSEVLTIDSANTATFSLDIPISGATASDNSVASYFTTTDADCPAIAHAVFVSLSPNVAPSAAELLNFQIATVNGENLLRLFPEALGTYNFWIEGKTVSDKVAYKPVQLTVVCGALSQELTLESTGSHEVEVLKNQNPVIVSLLDEATLQSLFVRTVTTRCPILSFELQTSAGAALASGDSLYSLLDVANRVTNLIKIDTTVAMTDGTVVNIEHPFKVKAIAEGGASLNKDILARIIVCGFESISLASPSLIERTLVVRDNVTDSIGVEALFVTNDTFCPVNSYAVKMSDASPSTATDPTAEQTLNVWLDQLEIKLFARDPGTFTFWIQGVTTTGKFNNQPAELVNTCGPNSQDIWLAVDGADQISVEKNQNPAVIILYSAANLIGHFV